MKNWLKNIAAILFIGTLIGTVGFLAYRTANMPEPPVTYTAYSVGGAEHVVCIVATREIRKNRTKWLGMQCLNKVSIREEQPTYYQ